MRRKHRCAQATDGRLYDKAKASPPECERRSLRLITNRRREIPRTDAGTAGAEEALVARRLRYRRLVQQSEGFALRTPDAAGTAVAEVNVVRAGCGSSTSTTKRRLRLPHSSRGRDRRCGGSVGARRLRYRRLVQQSEGFALRTPVAAGTAGAEEASVRAGYGNRRLVDKAKASPCALQTRQGLQVRRKRWCGQAAVSSSSTTKRRLRLAHSSRGRTAVRGGRSVGARSFGIVV